MTAMPFIDYDELEERLLAGEFASRRHFWAACGVSGNHAHALQRRVRADLMPEAREALAALPGNLGPTPHRLTLEVVRQIRELSSQGESREDLAKRFKVSRSTITDVVTERTWKEAS